MFFYENLLFLGALALLSWLVLCFINFIKENQQPYDRFDFSLENTLAEMFICEVSTYRRYQAYLICTTVFCVLYVTYELMRNPEILNVHKRRFGFRMFSAHPRKNSTASTRTRTTTTRTKTRTGTGKTTATDDNEERDQEQENCDGTGPVMDFDTLDSQCTIEEYRRMTRALRHEIDQICFRNNELIERIINLEQENLILMGKGLLLAREINEGYINRMTSGADYVVINDNDDDDGDGDVDVDNDSLAEKKRNGEQNVDITVGFTKIINSFVNSENETENEELDADGGNNKVIHDDSPTKYRRAGPKGISMFPFLQSLYFINRYIHIHASRSRMQFNNNNYNNNNNNNNNNDDNNGDFNEVWYKYIRMHNMGERISKMFDPDFADEAHEEENNRLRNTGYSETASHNTTDTVKDNDEDNSSAGLTNPNPVILTTEQLQMVHDLGIPLDDLIFEVAP